MGYIKKAGVWEVSLPRLLIWIFWPTPCIFLCHRASLLIQMLKCHPIILLEFSRGHQRSGWMCWGWLEKRWLHQLVSPSVGAFKLRAGNMEPVLWVVGRKSQYNTFLSVESSVFILLQNYILNRDTSPNIWLSRVWLNDTSPMYWSM